MAEILGVDISHWQGANSAGVHAGGGPVPIAERPTYRKVYNAAAREDLLASLGDLTLRSPDA